MARSVFRKDSIDRISSPEELHSYIRVASPGIWLVLGAVIALLVGFITFAIFAEVDGVQLITFLWN